MDSQLLQSSVVVDAKGLQELHCLLRDNKLPDQDVELRDTNLFLIYYDGNGTVSGTGGLEFYSDHALLRSIAVTEPMRGKGLGRAIVADLLDRAKTAAIKDVYLLTETARLFFQKTGFEDIDREAVPVNVKASSEFLHVCPLSAAAMVFPLARNTAVL